MLAASPTPDAPMSKLLLSTALAAVVFTAAVPEIRALADRFAAPAPEPQATAVAAPPPSGGARLGDVVVPADAAGHFRLDARVGGVRLGFLADTGATTVALRAADAARLGLRPAPADYVVPVATANGRVMAAPVTLDAVEVGPIRIAAVEALVLPDAALGGNLLGMSFLGRLGRFEVAGGRLVLSP